MAKINNEEILQEEIDEELIRLKKDEKIAKAVILITGILFAILIVNLIYVNYNLQNQPVDAQNIQVPIEVSSPTPTFQVSLDKISPAPTVASQKTVSLPKEYFIPFGSGKSSSNQWTDVEGLEVAVDLGSYGKIKDIKFEASIQVPGNNQFVSVRLFNKTDKHPVWNSEVTKDGGDASYVVSDPIIYDIGTKTYIVQMKTQLGSTVTLGEARLHIILQ